MTNQHCRISTIRLKPNRPALAQVFRAACGDYFKRIGLDLWKRISALEYARLSR